MLYSKGSHPDGDKDDPTKDAEMESSSWPTLRDLLYIVFHLTVCSVSIFSVREFLVALLRCN